MMIFSYICARNITYINNMTLHHAAIIIFIFVCFSIASNTDTRPPFTPKLSFAYNNSKNEVEGKILEGKLWTFTESIEPFVGESLINFDLKIESLILCCGTTHTYARCDRKSWLAVLIHEGNPTEYQAENHYDVSIHFQTDKHVSAVSLWFDSSPRSDFIENACHNSELYVHIDSLVNRNFAPTFESGDRFSHTLTSIHSSRHFHVGVNSWRVSTRAPLNAVEVFMPDEKNQIEPPDRYKEELATEAISTPKKEMSLASAVTAAMFVVGFMVLLAFYIKISISKKEHVTAVQF